MSGKPEKYQAVEFDVPKVDADGNPISTYETEAIMSFARAWTGLSRQPVRLRTLHVTRRQNVGSPKCKTL
mgnify:CR=1 FL=1